MDVREEGGCLWVLIAIAIVWGLILWGVYNLVGWLL